MIKRPTLKKEWEEVPDQELTLGFLTKLTEIAHVDFETRSLADLKRSGAYRYMEDPSTEVICMAYCIGSGPIKCWRPGMADPQDLLDHIAAGGIVAAHNALFERLIFWIVLPRMGYNWPKPSIEQMDCTMVRAYALALPGDLDQLGQVLRLSEQKDTEGSNLMKKMCKPRKARKGEDPTKVYWIEDEGSILRLMEYCIQDVATERAADKILLKLSKNEAYLWHRDQEMNDRGIAVDLKNSRKLMAIAKIVIAQGDARMAVVTRGAVTACTQATALIRYVHSRGIHCESVGKEEIDSIINQAKWAGDEELVEALELRKEFGKASPAKIKRIFDQVCKDGRVHGQVQFLGAAITGRDSGRGVQIQNLPRVDAKDDLPRVEKAFRILEECGNDIVTAAKRIASEVGEVLPLISKCLRGLIIAGEGKKLLGCDLSNIEGRGAAWLTGAQHTLDKFMKIDAGLLPDVYIMAYSEAFGVPVDQVTKAQRGVGKVIVLACGFQGSIGAFVRFATEALLISIVDTVKKAVSQETWDTSWNKYPSRRDLCELTREQWTAIHVTVFAWRKANPENVQGWYDLQEAAIEAVENPNRPVSVFDGKIVYILTKGFLWCRLPSGRPLAYYNPGIAYKYDEVILCEDGKVRPLDDVPPDELDRLEAAGVEIQQKNKRKCVEFEGYAQTGKGGQKKWIRRVPGGKHNLSLYGGRQLENCDQAFCRDIMMYGMVQAYKKGLDITMRIHDELVAEVDPDVSEDLLKEAMTTNPKWLPGFPLAAAAWSDQRYVK